MTAGSGEDDIIARYFRPIATHAEARGRAAYAKLTGVLSGRSRRLAPLSSAG